MIQAALHHRTTYRYPGPVRLGPQLIRLRPAPHGRTAVAGYALGIAPAGHRLHWLGDPFGNWQARVVLDEPAAAFEVTVDLVADLVPVNPFDFFLDAGADLYPFAYPPALLADLAPCLELEPAGPLLDALAVPFAGRPAGTVDLLVAANAAVRGRVAYIQRLEPGIQLPEQTLALASGSCRDSGWLLVQLLRRLGIAARFVSGYSIQLAGTAADAPAADTADLHAWAEAYLPGAGWVGLDPTSGLMTGEGHIPLCAVPHPRSAAPVAGTAEAVGEMDFAVEVARLGPGW